jgi:hypothetical protein
VTATTTTLPVEFADLDEWIEWALPTEEERYAKRLASTMDELRAFYDAIFARADDARKYLDTFDLEAMPEDAQRLLWMLFSLICVSYAVEIFGTPEVPDSGSAYMWRTGEPETYPV